jgi:hypothetical protein
VSGVVRDDRGAPPEDAAVLVFPADKALWRDFGLSPVRLKSVAVSTTGTYLVSGLPAGDYYLLGVTGGRADLWKDPDALEAASRLAMRVTLAWGDQKNLDLRIVQIR